MYTYLQLLVRAGYECVWILCLVPLKKCTLLKIADVPYLFLFL